MKLKPFIHGSELTYINSLTIKLLLVDYLLDWTFISIEMKNQSRK